MTGLARQVGQITGLWANKRPSSLAGQTVQVLSFRAKCDRSREWTVWLGPLPDPSWGNEPIESSQSNRLVPILDVHLECELTVLCGFDFSMHSAAHLKTRTWDNAIRIMSTLLRRAMRPLIGSCRREWKVHMMGEVQNIMRKSFIRPGKVATGIRTGVQNLAHEVAEILMAPMKVTRYVDRKGDHRVSLNYFCWDWETVMHQHVTGK